MNSQNNEEEIIGSYFSEASPCRFLDIGAYLPFDLSNVRRLCEKGWGGVLVEPSPLSFMALAKEYGKDPRFILINAAVASTTGLKKFYCAPSWASTLSIELMTKFPGHDWSLQFLVNTITTDDLVPFGPYSFVNIDAEGLDWEIASHLRKELFCGEKQMICVEHNHKTDSEWCHLMDLIGFKFHAKTKENRIFVVN